MPRRRGSPFTGTGAVFLKEFADHLGGARMFILEWLVLLTGVGAVYTAIQDIRATMAQDPFLFLHIFTQGHDPLPSFVAVLGFLIPLVAIGLSFDAVNSEFNRRTMSRLLAQPIYRDAVLLGKFLASLATLAVGLAALWLLMIGLGLVTMGVPPTGQETLRGLTFLVVAILYGAIWIAIALACSVVFRSTATSALAALGLWLLLTVLWPILTRFLTQAVYPAGADMPAVSLAQIDFQETIARLSPSRLFDEIMIGILHPSTRSLGPIYVDQLQGALVGAPLPFGQSLLLVWPELTALLGATIAVFVAAYVLFQRQEARG